MSAKIFYGKLDVLRTRDIKVGVIRSGGACEMHWNILWPSPAASEGLRLPVCYPSYPASPVWIPGTPSGKLCSVIYLLLHNSVLPSTSTDCNRRVNFYQRCADRYLNESL